MLEKYQMWVEMQPSAQPLLQKLNGDNSCQKHANLDITFLKPCPILLYSPSPRQISRPGL